MVTSQIFIMTKEYELKKSRKKFEIFKIKHSIIFIAGLAITNLASARSTTRYADASRSYGWDRKSSWGPDFNENREGYLPIT